jgi:choline dehydrogenase-like flavoprotein
MNLVVGSGPAGVAAAHALLEHGQEVTLLDTGLAMDADAVSLRRRARDGLDAGLTGIDADAVRAPVRPSNGSLPMKTLFGSDFPYRDMEGCAPLNGDDGVDLLMSYARGGLSNIWGANVLPFTRPELSSWPVPYPIMQRSYDSAMKLIRLSAARDEDLEAHLPLYTDRPEPRHLSRQAMGMLEDLTRNRAALARDDIVFGPSRIGVATAAHPQEPSCSQCGLCLDGCPHDLIYNSAHTLDRLRLNPRFRYMPGVYVRRYEDHPNHVLVTADEIGGSGPVNFTADRLYVGCGALSSTRLIMESLNRFDEPVRMLDSCYFIQPWLRWHTTPGVSAEKLQTLSQLCLRVGDASGTPVHALVYTYNDFLRQRLEQSPLRALPWLSRQLLDRMIVVQGYLHSGQSAGLEVRITAPKNTRSSVIQARALPNPRMVGALHRARKKLRSAAWHARATPVPGAFHVGRPGKGYHFGGGFPMRQSPKPFECDTLGRPFGAARVHLIDSSCFPDIPATNLTLTVMANAYRIASETHSLSSGG